jgi:hypothetical protein
MNTITIKLSPHLGYEVFSHTVESGLADHRSGNDVGLTPVDVSLYEKIEKNYRVLTIDLEEAKSLYDELWNLEDIVLGWADDDFSWYGVHRAIKSNLKKLRDFGVEVNERGWAIK